MWFLTSQMPVLSGRINSIPFSTTSNFCFPKILMKYRRNGQNFAMSKNTSNMLFKTCWTTCKKPHFSTWSRSRYTFFWMTRYHVCLISLTNPPQQTPPTPTPPSKVISSITNSRSLRFLPTFYLILIGSHGSQVSYHFSFFLFVLLFFFFVFATEFPPFCCPFTHVLIQSERLLVQKLFCMCFCTRL